MELSAAEHGKSPPRWWAREVVRFMRRPPRAYLSLVVIVVSVLDVMLLVDVAPIVGYGVAVLVGIAVVAAIIFELRQLFEFVAFPRPMWVDQTSLHHALPLYMDLKPRRLHLPPHHVELRYIEGISLEDGAGGGHDQIVLLRISNLVGAMTQYELPLSSFWIDIETFAAFLSARVKAAKEMAPQSTEFI